MSAVVVDFPLVPVIAISGHVATSIWRAHGKTTRCRRSPPHWPCVQELTVQCGSGMCQRHSRAPAPARQRLTSRSREDFAVFSPAACASEILRLVVVEGDDVQRSPSSSARAASETWTCRGRKTATRFPANVVTGIKAHLNLSVARPARAPAPRRRSRSGDHDLRTRSSRAARVVVDRRHLEHALAGQLERDDLHDHRRPLRQTSNRPPTIASTISCLIGNRDRAAAARPSASEPGVAHEDRGRRRVEPEKPRLAPITAPQSDRQLAGAGDDSGSADIRRTRRCPRDRRMTPKRRRDHDRHDRQTVETVGEIDRVAGTDDDECAQAGRTTHPRLNTSSFEERKRRATWRSCRGAGLRERRAGRRPR